MGGWLDEEDDGGDTMVFPNTDGFAVTSKELLLVLDCATFLERVVAEVVPPPTALPPVSPLLPAPPPAAIFSGVFGVIILAWKVEANTILVA